jgi:hypothetical protein
MYTPNQAGKRPWQEPSVKPLQLVTAKAWYQSWTVWANLLALILFVANGIGFANFQADPWVTEVGTIIVLVLNLVLRIWRTSQPISKGGDVDTRD